MPEVAYLNVRFIVFTAMTITFTVMIETVGRPETLLTTGSPRALRTQKIETELVEFEVLIVVTMKIIF
jgi:hypothetical protein